MRRSQARLSHMFKIMHKLTDFPDVPIDLRTFHYNSRSDNSVAITPFQCQSTQFLNSFSPRTASQWNSLPKSVVSKNTITSFKQTVTKFHLGLHVLLLAYGYSCILYTEIIMLKTKKIKNSSGPRTLHMTTDNTPLHIMHAWDFSYNYCQGPRGINFILLCIILGIITLSMTRFTYTCAGAVEGKWKWWGLKFARISVWRKFAFATPTFAHSHTRKQNRDTWFNKQVLAECYLIQ